MKEPHKKLRKELLLAFVGDFMAEDDVPDCFGTLPQSNGSAHFKGCYRCDLHTHSDCCSKATRICDGIRYNKQRFTFEGKRITCGVCEGHGRLRRMTGDSNICCPACNGAGGKMQYTFTLGPPPARAKS